MPNKLIFLGIHLVCLFALWTGVSSTAIFFCIFFYVLRMFGITAGYHRLFSHRSYSTSRWFQLFMAILGASSAQKGPLWWAASHRHHHRHSDTEQDLHSPKVHGIWWAHVGWVLSPLHDDADMDSVRDLTKYPELRFVERFHYIFPLLFLAMVYLLGVAIAHYAPSLHTTPGQMVVWAAFVSTVLLYHGTFAVNSATHVFGRRRFETGDESRNSFILALITLGEGWHNNHHRYPGSERQGFYWWELDISHLILVALSKLGLVWNLRSPPSRIYEEAAKRHAAGLGN